MNMPPIIELTWILKNQPRSQSTQILEFELYHSFTLDAHCQAQC